MLPFGRKKSSPEKSETVIEEEHLFSETFLKHDEHPQPKERRVDQVALFKTKKIHMSQDLIHFRDKIFERLVAQIDLTLATTMPLPEFKRQVEEFVKEFCDEQKAKVSLHEQRQISEEIVHEMVGLGPLEILITDPSINDIMVNRFDQVYIEQAGKLYLSDVKFRDPRHVLQIAQRIANMVGRRVDETSPMVDARLKDGSRVNIIIPPLALDGVSISIRKFSKVVIGLGDMVKQGNISSQLLDFLEVASQSRLNIIVSGGTGAGKTTLLNALSQLISPGDRIVTIEDSAELKLDQPHIVRLESRPSNIEGEGEVQIRDLLRNSLRMRPDRIVIGECRGAEAFDMLQAMNTGHDGSMSTLHANSAGEALHRLENLVLMAGHELPATVIRSYIADAVDLIIQVARMRDGVRRIVQVSEVVSSQQGEVHHQDIFVFKYLGTDAEGKILGEFECTNPEPHVMKKISLYGLEKKLKESLQKRA